MKKYFLFVGIIFAAFACSKDEANFSEELVRKTTDPVIEKYSDMRRIVKASDTHVAALPNCSPSLGIYLFTPDYGPFSGQTCEVYRYELTEDISGPCGDDFNLDYQENVLQGHKYIDCPTTGENCYTFQGPSTCVIVHCDENEV